MVFETQRLHVGWVEEVAAVKNQWACHGAANTGPIEKAKFVPLCEEDQGVRSYGSFIRVAAEKEAGIGNAGL